AAATDRWGDAFPDSRLPGGGGRGDRDRWLRRLRAVSIGWRASTRRRDSARSVAADAADFIERSRCISRALARWPRSRLQLGSKRHVSNLRAEPRTRIEYDAAHERQPAEHPAAMVARRSIHCLSR